ncbi:hypothetical protein ACI2IX_20000 [Leifsonia aquatica]|uniref:hypothetical protein n=1 Tax=Leifsonia aquatica TaxID=144185 RepID=UPI0038502CA8
MTCYTPTEIIQAGIDQTRETFADLYLQLDQARRAIDFHWHRANIDPTIGLLDGEERLPVHAAGTGFGGNDVALPARPVRLDRLTDAGLTLYQVGVRAALAEEDALRNQLAAAVDELQVWRRMPTRDERRKETARHLHGVAAAAVRHEPKTSTPVTAGPWAVRIPGTTTVLPAIDAEGDRRLRHAA